MLRAGKRNYYLMEGWFFIVNPHASKGLAARRWPQIAEKLRAHGLLLDYSFTGGPGQAGQCVEEGLRRGYRKLAAVGGDGTNFEVINGLVSQQLVNLSEITYTIFPIGTGNDWARQYQIPKQWQLWLDMVRRDETQQQDIGVVEFTRAGKKESVCFANVAGLAYDGYIGFISSHFRQFSGSRFFYLALVLWGLFRYRLSDMVIRFDGRLLTGKFYTVNAGICRYSGGGMQLTPHAEPADGKLALTVAGALSKLGVLLNTWRFYNGQIGGHPKVTLHQVSEIEVDGMEEGPLHVEADGEYLGVAPVRISVADWQLKVVHNHPVFI
jgi:diacylglycerol kinase (ATP)